MKGNGENPQEHPIIFTAVKEQLGLQLKSIQGPIDYLVIGDAEMPTEN